ncbi:hypothetical protein BJ912DRAFT_1056819 [Pholiota molesta]|nr:hypothetical protein BJ912DRAFT_1056819 [Pholiota molesta]
MLAIAVLASDISLIQMAPQLARVGKRTVDTIFSRGFEGNFLITANVHARRGQRPHLTGQAFDLGGVFIGGIHFNLEHHSVPTYRAYDPTKPLIYQRTARNWAHRNFYELDNYTIISL